MFCKTQIILVIRALEMKCHIFYSFQSPPKLVPINSSSIESTNLDQQHDNEILVGFWITEDYVHGMEKG